MTSCIESCEVRTRCSTLARHETAPVCGKKMEELLATFAGHEPFIHTDVFQELMDALYFNSPDPIVFVDKMGHITSMNDAARRSVTRNVESDKTWVDFLVAPAYSDQAREFELRRRMEKDLSDAFRTVLICEDGKQIEVEVRHRALNVGSGIGMLRLLFVRDVTTRESLARMLADANKALATAVSETNDFIASISHEIRNPIHAMLGLSEYLLGTELVGDQESCVRKIYTAGKMLLMLLNDVLDFAKSESGKLRLEEIDFDLRACIDETLSLLSDSAFGKGVELVAKLSTELPVVVRGDPLRLRQILTNLVSNSIKFTSNGFVSVTADVVQLHGDDTVQIKFTVQDSGIGISEESLATLFRPFTQGERSTTRLYGGTGLGLSICKALVERMGGEIHAVSDGPGTGSSFVFQIPLKVALQSAPSIPTFDAKRVLLISKSERMLDALMETASCCRGLCMETTTSVEAAAGKIYTESFDAIMVDSALAIEFHQFAPRRLVVLTEIGLLPQLRRVLGQTVTFVPKPVTQETLVQALGNTLQISPVVCRNASEPSSPKLLPFRRSLHVLVVDDNVVNQQVAAMFLKRAGHTIEVASNGLEAVMMVENSPAKKPFDVVLMDSIMPELDGLAATKCIRKLPEPLNRVRIVAMTASVFADDKQACLDAGMNAYLSKPYESRDLYAVLEPTDSEELLRMTDTTSSRRSELRLDISVLEAMCDGDIDSAAQLLTVFLSDLHKHRAGLSAAHQTAVAGMQAMTRIAHTLRGASATLGAHKLATYCRTIEEKVHKTRDEFMTVFESTSAELAAVAGEITVVLDNK
eukprot:TRINITY_DN7471_c0_g1_i1.p1 TRINITY_DN7471_c0_g1~~TRINITY_DN7471_c0_g1_i1.p1  ORF type:complete len:813 (-),score=145.88 TRINITY_DN7471_c0_g1_i1:429-2867(-)